MLSSTYRSCQDQLSSFQRLPTETAHPNLSKSGNLHMDHNVAIGGRLLTENLGRQKMPLQYIPRTSLFEKNRVLGCFARFLDTIWWLDDMNFGKTNIDTTPQCHHLLLVSRIIHINPFLVSALVGAENQVQHGTIKTIVGLRLHSDDGWDFWRGDCHQRKETELTQTTNSMHPQLWKKAKVKKVVCSIFEISVFQSHLWQLPHLNPSHFNTASLLVQLTANNAGYTLED